jgi:hypothetical protein
MATHYNEAQIASLPVESYPGTVRNGLRSGDLLFCSGNYLVSRMIRKVTNSPWSHVGIIIFARAIDRCLLLESVEDVGVRLAPLSKYLTDYEGGSPYDGSIVVARSSLITSPTDVTDDGKVKAIGTFGADALTLPYDKAEIGQILARVVLGVGKKDQHEGYICSELAGACLAEAGIQIAASSGGFVTPEDVWRDHTVEPLARLR